MRVHFTQIKERITTALDDSLFAKALLSAISVAKADRVQDRAATGPVRREVSVSCGYQQAFR